MAEFKIETSLKDVDLFKDLTQTLTDFVEYLDDYKDRGMTPKDVQNCLSDLEESLKFILE